MLSSVHIPEATCAHCQFNISWVKAALPKHGWLLISYLSVQQKQQDKLAAHHQPAMLGLKISVNTLEFWIQVTNQELSIQRGLIYNFLSICRPS